MTPAECAWGDDDMRSELLAAEQRRRQQQQTTEGAPLSAGAPPPSARCVPDDVATLLARLGLEAYGDALVYSLGVKNVGAAAFLHDADLAQIQMLPVERRMLLAAVAPGPPPPPPHRPPPPPPPLAPAASIDEAAAAAALLLVRALCVGINAYSSPVPGALSNAVADAHAVHEVFNGLPGAQSTLLTDCTKAELQAALKDFRDSCGLCVQRGMRVTAASAPDAARGAHTLAVFFFAGHGLQVSGRNYLVPSDFKPPRRNELKVMLRDTGDACLCLDAVEEALHDAHVTAGAVLLDCCRSVPDFLAELGAQRTVGGGTRALPVGMMHALPRLNDVMVTFATAPGMEAQDRSSRMPEHSPFTAALLRALGSRRRLLDLNPFLTDAVVRDTAGQQRPHVGGSYGTLAGNLTLGSS